MPTLTELTNRLVRLGGPRGVVALRGVAGEPGAVTEVIAEGLFKRYRYWAHRLVRTELQSTANTVLDEGIRDLHTRDPGIMRRWDASIDGRVCAVCRSLHNATAPVDAAFPGGYAAAPAHPNCRCRVGAWRRGWERYLAWMEAA
jgi:SPP1 gp7 family putative phage head morphogenesis protein